MSYGLRIYAAGGSTVIYDSTLAVGGVCVGFYTVPVGGGALTYPAFAGYTGFVLSAGRGVARPDLVVTDTSLGYPRFTFPAITAGHVFVLFVK